MWIGCAFGKRMRRNWGAVNSSGVRIRNLGFFDGSMHGRGKCQGLSRLGHRAVLACFCRGKMLGSAMLRCLGKTSLDARERRAWGRERMTRSASFLARLPATLCPVHRLLAGRATESNLWNLAFCREKSCRAVRRWRGLDFRCGERRYNRDATRNTEKIKVNQSESNPSISPDHECQPSSFPSATWSTAAASGCSCLRRSPSRPTRGDLRNSVLRNPVSRPTAFSG